MLHQELSSRIIRAFYKVYNTLGYGFLEKVYENAIIVECKMEAITATSQSPIKVFYESEKIGEYYADILVRDKVIVEIKAAKRLIEEHEAQLLNYLKATDIEFGLLFNFGGTPQFRRKIFSNVFKNRTLE